MMKIGNPELILRAREWLVSMLRDMVRDPLTSDLVKQVEKEGFDVCIEFVENGPSCPVDESRIYLARSGGKEIGSSSPREQLVNVLRSIATDSLMSRIIEDVKSEGFDACIEFVKKDRFDKHRIHEVRKPEPPL